LYELSKVRLHTVGPKGARYHDVTLNLRRAGAFTASGEFGVGRDLVHRPAPATVLFLENGGGKTVLIKLIFSVMLPGRRQVVGTSSTRVLDKFVLAGDVAHVALEWQDAKTGQLLVTGKASEWRGHVVSTDPSRLIERWYSFRPTASLDLSTLPFTENGRLLSLAGFRDRLEEEQRANPAAQVVWEKNHGDWTSHLGSLQLDPELFSYQRKMNAGEGEAADAFTFKTDDAFVDWLLTAIIPDEEPQSLGDLVAVYADKLARRGELMAERDFVEGALERLRPLARAAGERTAATDIHAEANAEVERLIAAMAARQAQEDERKQIQLGQHNDVETRERTADQEVRRLNSIVLELSRLVAKLRWEQASEELHRLKSERDDVRRLLAAWLATDILVRYNTANEEAEQIRDIVRQQEIEAVPILQARDVAAKKLARGLLDMAKLADAAATRADDCATALEEDIGQAEDARQERIAEAEAAKARITQATENIGKAQAAVADAIGAGLLAARDNVAAAAEAAERAAAEAETTLADALTRGDELATQREDAASALQDRQADVQRKSGIAKTLAGQLATARRGAEELCSTGRLADLFGSEEIVLDSDADALLDLLAEAISTAEQEQVRLHMDAEADDRVLEALGNGGLLPPGDDVNAALAVLAGKDITAWSGWQYLASVRSDERDQVLARHPHLVDGIVLNSGDDLDLAREELTAARLLPRTIIAVGTTAAIAANDAREPADIGFIVPPTPAMYDSEQAEQERQEIQHCYETRRVQLTQLATVIAADRELSSRLAVWRRDYPPGRLGRLSGDYYRAAADLQAEEELEREQRGVHKDLIAAEKELRRRRPALNAQATETKKRAVKLATLAAEYAKIPGWHETIRSARGDVTRAEDGARRAHSQALELRRQQSEAHREGDDQRRIAVDCREQLSAATGGGSVDEAMPVPEEPLESLRAAYRAAETAYEKAEVGSDLRAELSRADNAEASARAAVEGIALETREQASALLNTPDGTDTAARAAATARTGRFADALEGRVTDAASEDGKLKQQYESFQPQERSLEPYGRPRDIPHGEELISAATVERDEARKNLDEIQARKEALQQQIAATDVTITEFGAVRESLVGIVVIEAAPEAEPFAGSVEAARLRRDKVRETFGEAVRLLEDATQQVRRAADALAQHATNERFEKVAAPVRRQMIATDREQLPDFAEEWEAALRPRFRVLSDELEQLERHRAAIITRLQGMVTYALGRLRAAQKASRLPDGLGDWSGLEFLRIGFTQPEEAVITERLGQVIDDATVAGAGTERTSGKRDGLSLMLTGVRAALRPRGVRVDMLKPDAVLRDERVRVAEIGDVFSGGQLLTAAIILYCTMASLRASERGQARRQHAGVLFLDNPIGRASAGYLLELQLAVADKLKVQLVYTTGLFDTNALSVFPLIVRLRNDADLRAGMKYLSVDEEIRARLPDKPSDGSGVLTASRLFVRPADLVP
jgi:hypothetical protein